MSRERDLAERGRADGSALGDLNGVAVEVIVISDAAIH
jgi:hypothetical protein